MNGCLVIARTEVATLVRAPSTWILAAVFLLAAGYGFASSPATHLETSMRGAFGFALFALMFVAPALATRLCAREIEQGTIELSLTAPVEDASFVMGKYLAGLATIGGLLAGTLVLLVLLAAFGEPEWRVVAGGYLAIVLVAALFLSLSVLGALLAGTQALGFVLGAALVVGTWFSGQFIAAIPGLPPGTVAALSLPVQFGDLTGGVLDIRALVLPLSLVATALFLSVRVLETRRWV